MFDIELDLPSGKKIRIPELKNKDYLSIIKFCENKDYAGLNNIFSKLFFTPDLDIIDRFFILVYARMVFVSDELGLTSKKDVNIKIRLSTILDTLIVNYSSEEKLIKCNDLEVAVCIPIGSYFDSVDDLYVSTIRYIKLNSDKIDFSTLEYKDKEEILNRLPSPVFLEIQSYIKALSDRVLDITLIEQNDDLGLDEAKISILGNGVMHFICSIYSYDLFSFYETLYNYNHFVSNGGGDFWDLTFNEIMLMIKMHAERIKKENDEAKRREQT